MKTNRSRATKTARFNPAELLFWLLPLLALIPNFFLIPDLSYTGLATQEFVFALAVAAFALAALVKAFSLPATISLTKAHALPLLALGLFLLWQALSLFWSPDWSEGTRMLGFWFGFSLIVLSSQWTLTEKSFWPVFAAIAITTGLLLWSLIYEYISYGPDQMLGIFFNHGISAELLALLLPFFLLIFLVEQEKTWAVIIAFIAASGSIAALLLTLRRGPLLATVITIAGIAILLLSKTIRVTDKRRLYVVLGALLLVVTPLAIYKRTALITRLQGALQLKTAASNQAVELGLTSRAVTWLTAWEMGKHNPLKGVGVGGFEANYGAYKSYFANNPRYADVAVAAETEDYDEIRSPRAHSEYLQIFAELGLVGLLLFGAFWVLLLRQLWQRRTGPHGYRALGVLLALVAFAVCSLMSAFSFRSTPGLMLLTCLLALGLAQRAAEEVEHAAGSLTLPKTWLLVLAGLSVVAALVLVGRNYNVYASQEAQSQLDFRFHLDDESKNEILVRRYERVLDLDPANAGAHLGYSLLLFQMKRLPESAQHADYAFQHGYGRPFTYLLRAFCQEQMGDLTQATQTLTTGLASFPKSIVLRAAYAEFLRKQGQSDQAAEQRAILQRTDPRIARSWELALRMKDGPATEAARKDGVFAPGELEPMLARTLVQARAYHYLK